MKLTCLPRRLNQNYCHMCHPRRRFQSNEASRYFWIRIYYGIFFFYFLGNFNSGTAMNVFGAAMRPINSLLAYGFSAKGLFRPYTKLQNAVTGR